MSNPIIDRADVGMRIYIRNEDVERINKGCDLGDSVGVSVYLYPFTDHAKDMTAFDSYQPPSALSAEDEEFISHCEEHLKRLGVKPLWDSEIDRLIALARKK